VKLLLRSSGRQRSGLRSRPKLQRGRLRRDRTLRT